MGMDSLLKQKSKIDKYGSLLAFLTWLPFVGDVFAIGLGFYKLHFGRCALFMLIGKGTRFAFWLALYYIFGDKKCVTLHPVLTYGVMVALQILVLSVEVRILLGQQHNDKIFFHNFTFFDNYTPVHQRV